MRIFSAGGLGNQLFAWNFAHYLSSEKGIRNVKVRFDISEEEFRHGISQMQPLCKHGIKAQRINKLEKYFWIFFDALLRRSYCFQKVMLKQSYIMTEGQVENWSECLRSNGLVRGFFQDKHFKIAINYVLDEMDSLFQLRVLTKSRDVAQVLNFIDSQDAVVVHSRRGDYLDNRDTLGVLALEYFIKQAKEFNIVVLFSNDQLWIEDVTRLRSKWIGYSANEMDTWETLMVLAYSRNLIISNSTYSWWAAQYSLKNGGQVIAPDPWFKDPKYINEVFYDERFILKTSVFEEI